MLSSSNFEFKPISTFFGVRCYGDYVDLDDFVALTDSSKYMQITRIFEKCFQYTMHGSTCVSKRYKFLLTVNVL